MPNITFQYNIRTSRFWKLKTKIQIQIVIVYCKTGSKGLSNPARYHFHNITFQYNIRTSRFCELKNTNTKIEIGIVYCKTGSFGLHNPIISMPQYYIPILY